MDPAGEDQPFFVVILFGDDGDGGLPYPLDELIRSGVIAWLLLIRVLEGLPGKLLSEAAFAQSFQCVIGPDDATVVIIS